LHIDPDYLPDTLGADECGCNRHDSLAMADNVHLIGRVPLTDSPARLRLLADELEKEGGEPAVIVIVGRDVTDVSIYGYGKGVSFLEMVGWLSIAQTYATK
jgi:hypothetical protein